VLPIAELRFQDFPAGKPRIVGYAAKWDTTSFEYRNTVRSFEVEAELAGRARELALHCWELFALGGYARVDFRVDSGGRPWILEINANPCLSPDAGFAAAAAEAGIDFDTMIAALLEDALRRARSGGIP
jgi:D-alanine-D-alanine ligase